MAQKGKYVAYVSTYTMGDNHGISIYDVDIKEGRFSLKDRVEITNSSYLTISHNRKYLYSITDFGVRFSLTEDCTTGIWLPSTGCGDVIFPPIMRTASFLWRAGTTGRLRRCGCGRTAAWERSPTKFSTGVWEVLPSVISAPM